MATTIIGCIYWGILGLNKNNGKENGNCYNGVYIGIYCLYLYGDNAIIGYTYIHICILAYIGYRDNQKESGNYLNSG